MMQKNKTGLVFASIYLACALFAVGALFMGGEFGGIYLLIASLPWYLIISPLIYFLTEFFLLKDFGSILELLSMALSVSFNVFLFYHIGKLFSKLWNKSAVQ